MATGINLDSPSSSRRRSATVGPGMLARLAKDVEKISIGQPSTTSATSGTPPNLLTVHDVPPFKNPPRRKVRCTRSNSNLFSRSSSEDFANCRREGVLLPLPTVESKHQGSFIRVRQSVLKGLSGVFDSSVDLMEGRNVRSVCGR